VPAEGREQAAAGRHLRDQVPFQRGPVLVQGLVQLLRARNIYYELTVIPDDLHESMLHSRWIDTWNRMGNFLKRFVWSGEVATGNHEKQ